MRATGTTAHIVGMSTPDVPAPVPGSFLDTKWRRIFAEFTAWVNNHGHLPSRRSSDEDEYRLANWLNVQRANDRKGKLDGDYRDLLDTIRGALRAYDPEAPSERAAELAVFWKDTRRLPSTASTDRAEKRLAHYMNTTLRANSRSGILDPRIARQVAHIPGALKAVTVKLSPAERLEQLKAYVAEHGAGPDDASTAPDGLLAWVNRSTGPNALESRPSHRKVKAGLIELLNTLAASSAA